PFDDPRRGGPGRPLDGDPGARGRGFGRGGPGVPGRPFRAAPVIAGGQAVGLVIVPPQPPFTFLLSRYAPTLGVVAIGTLIAGTILATLVIFGPARKRLRA